VLDFTELSQDGQHFEQLVRELLFSLGHKVFWTGRGPDGGRDLLCLEERPSMFFTDTRRWLIQCKHKAHSQSSVGVKDLDDVIDSCAQHECEGYLLVTSTQPSSAVVQRLERITANPANRIVTACWDAVELERKLRSPAHWNIAQRFFPVSASGWKIYATDRPNHWSANFNGYYFHITSRIGSSCDRYLPEIEDKIAAYEELGLPPKHFVRMRSVFYDDKHGTFTWYLDYMHPHDESPVMSPEQIAQALGEDDIWNHSHDVEVRHYSEFSDHYDPDHYDYYLENMGQFILGLPRTKT